MAFAAMVLVAAGGSAAAKTYNINLDGYCDEFEFTVTKSLIVGVSYGIYNGYGCDQANMVGSLLTLTQTVAPGGPVAALASDLGGSIYGDQFMIYLNLANHTFVLYEKVYGSLLQYAAVGTWSDIKTQTSATMARVHSLPSLVATLRQRGGAAPAVVTGGGVQ